METKLSKVLLVIILYLFQIDICSIMANDPSDFRFVSYNGMYMWESTPFVFLFLLSFPRQTKSTIQNAYTSVCEISCIKTGVKIIVKKKRDSWTILKFLSSDVNIITLFVFRQNKSPSWFVEKKNFENNPLYCFYWIYMSQLWMNSSIFYSKVYICHLFE